MVQPPKDSPPSAQPSRAKPTIPHPTSSPSSPRKQPSPTSHGPEAPAISHHPEVIISPASVLPTGTTIDLALAYSRMGEAARKVITAALASSTQPLIHQSKEQNKLLAKLQKERIVVEPPVCHIGHTEVDQGAAEIFQRVPMPRYLCQVIIFLITPLLASLVVSPLKPATPYPRFLARHPPSQRSNLLPAGAQDVTTESLRKQSSHRSRSRSRSQHKKSRHH